MENILYSTASALARSAEVFNRTSANTNTEVIDVNGCDKVCHELITARMANSTLISYATIYIDQMARFYKALDVIQLDNNEEYVMTCVVLEKAEDSKISIILQSPVIEFFNGNHMNLATRILDIENCAQLSVIIFYCLCS